MNSNGKSKIITFSIGFLMRKKVVLFILFSIASQLFAIAGGLEYSRTGEYKRIVLDAERLNEIIIAIEYYNKKLDSNQLDNTIFECSISNESKSITTSDLSVFKDYSKDNSQYNEVRISYRAKNAEITSVDISLNQSYRQVKIGGNAERSVNALFAEIDNVLRSKEKILFGTQFKILLGTILFTMYIFSIIIAVLRSRFVIEGLSKKNMNRVYLIAYVICISFSVYFFLPYSIDDMLPNFTFYFNKVSWIDKNINFLSFIGLIISLFAFIPPIMRFVGKYKLKFEKSEGENNDSK